MTEQSHRLHWVGAGNESNDFVCWLMLLGCVTMVFLTTIGLVTK